MKAVANVPTQKAAAALKAGMNDPVVQAHACIVGVIVSMKLTKGQSELVLKSALDYVTAEQGLFPFVKPE